VAIEALQFALTNIETAAKSEEQLITEVLADWDNYCKTGERNFPRPFEECAEGAEPEPSLVSDEDWKALLFQIHGGWRSVCGRLADGLKEAGFRDEARAILAEIPTGPEGLDATARRNDERQRITTLLDILQPMAEDLEVTGSGSPRNVTVVADHPSDDVGVTMFDVAFAIEDDDKAAASSTKTWIDSKRITANPIGKCPIDARKQLYRLSELLDDVKKILALSSREVAQYQQALRAKQRAPRSD